MQNKLDQYFATIDFIRINKTAVLLLLASRSNAHD
jgi:hypothetical protein